MNKIIINGILSKEDIKYNQNYVYSLDVARKSETVDTLLVLSSKDLLEGPVHIEGILQAEYIYGLGVPVTIIPDTVVSGEADGYSEIEITGVLKDKPICRSTKKGIAIASVILNTDKGPIPVLLWGRNAKKAEQNFEKGDYVKVTGRLQSREYPDKNHNIRRTYELSASRIEIMSENDEV